MRGAGRCDSAQADREHDQRPRDKKKSQSKKKKKYIQIGGLEDLRLVVDDFDLVLFNDHRNRCVIQYMKLGHVFQLKA